MTYQSPFMPTLTMLLRARTLQCGLALAALLALPHGPAHAQDATAIGGAAGGIEVGQDLDEYLRYLQTISQIPVVPWGLRPFSPKMVDSITTVTGTHPWETTWMFRHPTNAWWRVLPADVTARYNSGYPYGINDGPVWAGRGFTTSITAGVVGSIGPLAVVIRPLAFRAENKAFPLQQTGYGGDGRFADPHFPANIDRPQRFGDKPYQRIEPGETTLRVDGLGVAAGFTTANEWWGPASTFPYIVGNNAAGVPRFFIETERPTNVLLGRLSARLEYGVELQSRYSQVVGPDTFVNLDSTGRRRFMSGVVVTFSPAMIPGLELGGARYFHERWEGHVRSADLRLPFAGLLVASSGVTGPAGTDSGAISNQLASIWARWVFPRSGLEVYGEYGHEDHNIDTRDLYSELDHSRAAMIGMRKIVRQDASTFDAIRAEIFDATASTNARHRGEGLMYVHYPLRQGHTEEGQVIGAGAGVGSPAAALIAWDRFTHTGKLTTYLLKMSENTFTAPTTSSDPQTSVTLGANLRRIGNRQDVMLGAAAVRSTRLQGYGGWNMQVVAGTQLHTL